MENTEQLTRLIREEYNALDQAGEEAISPAALAKIVFSRIDPSHLSPGLVETAAVLQLRQLSRGVCRQRLVESEHEAEQAKLFDFELQPRYPAARKIDGETEDVYVLRARLTLEERKRNVERLRTEGEAKLKHADALEAETEHLIRNGQLAMERVSK